MEVMFNFSFFSDDVERNTAYAVYEAPTTRIWTSFQTYKSYAKYSACLRLLNISFFFVLINIQ